MWEVSFLTTFLPLTIHFSEFWPYYTLVWRTVIINELLQLLTIVYNTRESPQLVVIPASKKSIHVSSRCLGSTQIIKALTFKTAEQGGTNRPQVIPRDSGAGSLWPFSLVRDMVLIPKDMCSAKR